MELKIATFPFESCRNEKSLGINEMDKDDARALTFIRLQELRMFKSLRETMKISF